MKTIKGIEEKLSLVEDVAPGADVQLPSYRQMFKAAVGNSLGKDGDNSIDLYQLGLKLKVEGKSLDLEDAEFKLLKTACETNPAQWKAHFHAQVLIKLKDSEKTPKKLEVK